MGVAHCLNDQPVALPTRLLKKVPGVDFGLYLVSCRLPNRLPEHGK
jgi:hypothetical protein